jgi:SAM-dependent methyltransferase
MNIEKLRKNWDAFGERDPFWAALTVGDRIGGAWNVEDFFRTGDDEIDHVMTRVRAINTAGAYHRALDFGCGVGRLTQALARHYDEAVGVDIAPSMIQQANQYNRRNNCKYYCNTAADLGMFNDGEFDLIYTRLVLQHMKPAYSKKYILEFIRILRTGGLLVFQLPSARRRGNGALSSLLRTMASESFIDWLFHRRIRFQSWLRHKPVMEMYYISKDDIVNLCRGQGCEMLEIQDESPAGSVWISSTYFVRKNSLTVRYVHDQCANASR